MKTRSFDGQQSLDISTSGEDALEIDPTALDVDPDVKEGVDAVELVLPRDRFFFEDLVVGRELHRVHGVDVLLELVEQVVPATDELALVLVADQVEFVRLPELFDLPRRKKQEPFRIVNSIP